MVESQVTCDNYRCHEYGSKMQRNVFYEDDDEMEYFSCNKCRNTTTPQIVEIEMGNCYMCDKPAVFIAHDLPTGEKPFCSELHFCQYARLSYHGEGYYGFTDPTKVKEPARLARARKRLKYAEATNEWKVGDKVKIINHITYRVKPSDIGKIATVAVKYDGTTTYLLIDDDGRYILIGAQDLELYELYIPSKTNPRKALLKKRFGFGAESFSAEKVKKEILEDDDDRLVMKFIYKDREGKLEWSDNEDGKGGVLSFGDNPFKKGERMSRLPHTQIIDSATSKLAAKEMFRLSLDRKCHACKEPIYKKDIGSCGWCEDEMGPSKFDDTYFYEDDWFKRLSPTTQDWYIHDLANKNPYCRDCLYYYGLGKNYPSAFDKESANYYLANAVCEKHWDEIVAEGRLSKDTKRNSLYEIENVSPRERMMKQRFGFGAENEYVKTGVASLAIITLLGLTLFKRD